MKEFRRTLVLVVVALLVTGCQSASSPRASQVPSYNPAPAYLEELSSHPSTIHASYQQLRTFPDSVSIDLWQSAASLDSRNDLGLSRYEHFVQLLDDDQFSYYLKAGEVTHEDGLVADVLSFAIGPHARRNLEQTIAYVNVETAIRAGHRRAAIAALLMLGSQQHSSRQAVENALRRVENLAGAGDTFAMGALAFVYHYGNFGVEPDFAQAQRWAEAGAELGDPTALYIRGRHYMEGTELAQDRSLGLDYYIRAAERGSQEAAYVLGLELVRPDVPEQDIPAGIFWLERASQDNYAPAQYELGKIFSAGELVPPDPDLANALLLHSASARYADAQWELAQMARSDDEQVSDKEAYVFWLTQGAVDGHARSQFALAEHHINRGGETQDWESALPWLAMAAEQEHREALANLAYALSTGRGTEVNRSLAVELHKRAAALGQSSSMRDIGIAYMYGRGVEIDYEVAKEWYQRALEVRDYVEAHSGLGFILWDTDRDAAVRHYFKAADLGSISARDNLVTWLSQGNFLDIDIDGAVKWLKFAADEGNADAMRQLAMLNNAGELLERNEEEFLKYAHMAAEAGDAETQVVLAMVYGQGRGVEQDYERMQYWLEQAVEQKFYPAYAPLSLLLSSSSIPGDRMARDARAQALVDEAAAAGNEMALTLQSSRNAARPNAEGPIDFARLESAANSGNITALLSLAIAYYEGNGTERDLERAYALGLQAAERGHGSAQYLVGKMYDFGEGVEKDAIEAYKWMSLAARLGHPAAAAYLPDLADVMSETEIGIAERRVQEWWDKQPALANRPSASAVPQ